MTDPPGDPAIPQVIPVVPTVRRTGLVALMCSLVATTHSLLARTVALHETGLAGFPALTLVRESLFGALFIVALVLGFRALRRSGARDKTLALMAIALAAPAVGDALAFLLELVGVSPERNLFLALTAAPVLLAITLAVRSDERTQPHSAAPAKRPLVASRSGTGSGSGTGTGTGTGSLGLWIGRLALVVTSIVLGLLLCEGAFRLFGPRRLELPKLIVPGSETTSLSRIALMRPYGSITAGEGLATRFPPRMFMKGWYDEPEWDYFDEDGCVDYVFNQHGLRDNDFEFQKQEGELRVVAIGDSFTFGVGVQLEDNWTEVLQRKLQTVHDGPVEVINAGFVTGHRPPGYEKWLLTDGVRLQPDMVIVGLCLNDLHPDIDLYAYRSVKPGAVLGGWSELVTHLRRRALAKDPQPRSFLGMIKKDPSFRDETEAALLRTARALEAQGIRFVVAVFPVLSGLQDDEYPYDGIIDMVTSDCAEAGIECVDLRDRFLGLEDRTLWVHPTDQHPNDIGQRMMGEGIFDYLQQH